MELRKEQLLEIIETDHVQCGEAAYMARRLIAAEEQQAVAWMVGGWATHDKKWAVRRSEEDNLLLEPLYLHPQQGKAVQLPDEMTIRDACKFVQDMRIFDDVSVIVMRTWNACRAAMLTSEPVGNRDELPSTCGCQTCRPVTMTDMRFVVCPDCGNKRCPKANDHRNTCSGSNEPGQEGSAYPAAPKPEVK